MPQATLEIKLPPWLTDLRRKEITSPLLEDERTPPSNSPLDRKPLGFTREQAEAILESGRADFDHGCPEKDLSPEDLVSLYAYWNQLRHLAELIAVLGELRKRYMGEKNAPIIVDLGCGPFTGGLAAEEVFKGVGYSYIGWDKSKAMLELGEQLAYAVPSDNRRSITIQSPVLTHDLTNTTHEKRPVLVIMSYLLSSKKLNVETMLDDLIGLLNHISHGDVKVLYTNTTKLANDNYSYLAKMLHKNGFEKKPFFDEDIVHIVATRIYRNKEVTREYDTRCTLFHRPKQ